MSLLQLTGAPRPQNGTFWNSTRPNRLVITGKDGADNWTDGVVRVALPIIGQLNASGTAWVTPGGGAIFVPGADLGDSVVPPVLDVYYEVTDNYGNTSGNMGLNARAHQRQFAAVTGSPGLVAWGGADRPLTVVNNPGVNPAALTVSAIGSTVAPFPLTAAMLPPGYDFIADGVAGVLNWNDVTNCAPGIGPTLLSGNATNGPSASNEYYYVQNIVFAAIGSNMTQIAYPYQVDLAGANDVYIRSRFSGAWTPWERIVTAKALPALPPAGISYAYNAGQTGAITGMTAAITAVDLTARLAYVRVQFEFAPASQITAYTAFAATIPAGWSIAGGSCGAVSTSSGAPSKVGNFNTLVYVETLPGAVAMQMDLILAAS